MLPTKLGKVLPLKAATDEGDGEVILNVILYYT